MAPRLHILNEEGTDVYTKKCMGHIQTQDSLNSEVCFNNWTVLKL